MRGLTMNEENRSALDRELFSELIESGCLENSDLETSDLENSDLETSDPLKNRSAMRTRVALRVDF